MLESLVDESLADVELDVGSEKDPTLLNNSMAVATGDED